jgi:hypothetical protein
MAGLPVGHDATDDVGQALGGGEVGRIEVPVAGVAGHVDQGLSGGERRRRGVVAAPPQLELLGAELLLDLGLVLPLQVPVVALVEPPVAADREPAAAGGARASSAVRMARVRTEVCRTRRSRPSTAASSLPPARASASPARGQVDVDPPGEQVLGVPGGLPVAEQDQIEHVTSVGGSGGKMETTSSEG